MINSLDTDESRNQPGGNLTAVAYGLAGLALTLIPIALFLAGFDEGPRGAWSFADAKNWVGLARFCFASLIVLGPVLLLAKRGRDRAVHPLAALPSVLALFLAMPMIPGAVIQLLWWIAK